MYVYVAVGLREALEAWSFNLVFCRQIAELTAIFGTCISSH